jgi:hypothetical protein
MRPRHSRRTLPTHRSARAFARGATIGALITFRPSDRKTSSNAAMNLRSRSRIRIRGVCRDVELHAAGPQRVRNRAIASGQLCRLGELQLAQPVRFHGDAQLRALDHSHMVCDTEGGPCGCRDLPGAMTIAGECVSECHREASRVSRGRKFLGGRCTGPVAVASRPEQRQFAAGSVLEPQQTEEELQLLIKQQVVFDSDLLADPSTDISSLLKPAANER